MSKYPIDNSIHRQLAVQFFNEIWKYLDIPERSEEYNSKMLHYAHSSFLHWSLYEKHTALNIQIAEYILAKAYLHAGDVKNALRYAKDCLATTLEHQDKMRDFDLAFAYAINAAANKYGGNQNGFEKYSALATQKGDAIKKKEDRDYFKQDFEKDLSLPVSK